MAISREKKEAAVANLADLLKDAKLTVLARYTGLTVADMQTLRREAKENAVHVLVTKNRLAKIAFKQAGHQSTDLSVFTGQLALAVGNNEVASAQSLAQFAKTHPALEIVAGITDEDRLLSAEEIQALAALPSKDDLRVQLVATIAAPLSGFMNVLSGNMRDLLNVLNARAEEIK